MKNTVVLTIVTFRHIQCLHLMYAEVDWTLVSLGTQVQPQVIFDPDYLPDYISISYDYTGIDKLYWYCNNSYEAKYHLPIGKRKSAGCRFKAV